MALTNTKRIIYISLGIIILGLLGFFAYRYFTPSSVTPTTPGGGVSGRLSPAPSGVTGGKAPEQTKPGQEITGAPEEKLIRLTDFPVVSPSLNKDGDKVYYYKKDGGDLFLSDFIGKSQEKISNITIVGLQGALWSPARDRRAVFYLDNETLKAFLHIGTSSVAILPQNIKSFSWSPDGKSLAYLLQKNGRLNLVTADSSGKNAKTVFSTPVLDAQINWITSEKITFQTAASGLAEGYLFTFSRSSGTFRRILGPFFGLMSLWSPDGSRVLVASTRDNGTGLVLGIRDANGDLLFAISAATLPEKCAWADANEIYCAVPRTILPTTIWPDDYLRGELNTDDRVVLFNLAKKETRILFDEGGFDMSNLLLTKDQNHLLFVNRADGTLWSLKLGK